MNRVPRRTSCNGLKVVRVRVRPYQHMKFPKSRPHDMGAVIRIKCVG